MMTNEFCESLIYGKQILPKIKWQKYKTMWEKLLSESQKLLIMIFFLNTNTIKIKCWQNSSCTDHVCFQVPNHIES